MNEDWQWISVGWVLDGRWMGIGFDGLSGLGLAMRRLKKTMIDSQLGGGSV